MRLIKAPALAGIAIAVGLGPAAAKELRYGTPLSGTGTIVKATKVTFDRITKATNGSLTFKIYANGEIVKSRTVLKGIANGVVDLGHVVWVVQPTEFRHASIAANALAFTNNILPTAGAVAEFFLVQCKECLKEFRKAKVYPLGAESASRYALMCSKEFKTVEELKGVRVRAVGAMARWAKELGMIPTRLAAPETGTAMQRGTVPCSFALLPWLEAYSVKDAAKFIIDRRKGTALGGGSLWINANSWRKLTDAQRKAIWDELPDHIYRLTAEAYGSEADKSRKAAENEYGIKVVDAVPGYDAAWKRFEEKEREALIALAKRRKVKNPEKFVDDMIALFRKWDALMAGKENDPQTFKTLLKTRVLDKTTLFKVKN